MAARKEILSDLSTKIADGNISDAYRTFEQLPVVDQIAVSISPGVGDALAAYEVGEFGRRAKTNIQDQDRLGAAGNIALSALSGISLYPLFRFLRGARGVTKTATKAVDAPKIIKPPVEEPLQLAPPKELEIKIPKIEPFEPKGIKEINYQAGEFEFGSKARKWLNGIEQPNITTLGKKVQKLPVEQWVQRLENAGVPKGELRLLNILDESNSIHPKLIMSADAKKSLTRKSLDDYIARSQRNAIQIRNTPQDLLESVTYRPDTIDPATQGQFNYFVRGSGEFRNKPHHNVKLKYPDGFSGDNSYVFDGTGKYNAFGRLVNLRPRLAPVDFKTIQNDLRELKLDPRIQGKNLFRMQSDFQEEVSRKIRKPQIDQMISAKSNFDSVVKIPRVYQEANKSIKDAISVGPDAKIVGTQRTELMNNLKPEFVDALRANDEQAMRKILGDDLYKTFTDTEFGTRVPGKFFAPYAEFKSTVGLVGFIEEKILTSLKGKGKSGYIELTPKDITKIFPELDVLKKEPEFDRVVKEIFKRTNNTLKIKQKIFKSNPTGFIKPEQQKIILKRLKNYNKEVDAVNDLTASGGRVDIDAIIESLNRDVTDLGIDRVSLSPKELERVTGKPFTESLDLTPADIYNLTDRFGRRIYKGIDFDDPGALSKAYFDDMADEGKTFFEAADGVKVLKKATGINQSQYGMKIDPYFEGGNSKYFKLPVRANILDSAKKGDDFLFIGEQQAAAESFGTDVIKTYQSAQNEIKKVLKELGVSEQGVVKTIKGTGTEFDGTYLKFTDKLKEAIEKQGVNAFKRGGPVEKSSRINNFLKNITKKLNNAADNVLDENETYQQIKQFTNSPEARVYIETVLKKNEEPITQNFFNDQENNIFKKEILSTLVNNADIHDYNSYRKDKEIKNYENFSSMPIQYYGSPMRSVFGNSRLRIPKNVKYEDAEIEIFDKYDFGGEFAGEGYISNLKKIYDGIRNKNTQDVMLGIEYFAERYGRGVYPEPEFAEKKEIEPNFVPVSLKYPVSDLMTKEQWEAYSKKYFDQFEGDTEGYSYDWGILEDPYIKDGKRISYRYSEEGRKDVEGLGNITKFAEYLSGSDDPYVGINVTSLEPDVLVEKKAAGGEVPSERQQAKLSKNKLDEIEAELQDILTFRVYDNLFKGRPLDELYQDYDASKDVVKNIESQVSKNLAESLKLPYQDAIADILQADDPSKEFAKRKDAFQLRKIDEAISALNLPVDVNVGLDSAQITKEIPLPGNVDLAFGAFKDPNRDVKTAAGLGFTESGKFGDLDIFGATGDYMPPGLYADYTLGDIKKGPLQIDVTKTPGSDIDTKAQLKIGDKTSPFQFDVMKQPGRDYALSGRYTLDKDIFPADSLYGQTYRVPTQLEISKQPNQDLYGKYEIDILGGEGQSLAPIRDFNIAPGTRLGGRGSIGLSFMVDTLKNAGLRLQYMYENPETGGFFNVTYDPKATQTINIPDDIDTQLRELTFGQPLSIEFGRQF